jgi:hypothetical protein
MNEYELATPRAALGLTAVALAAVTFGLLVVLPAKLDAYGAAAHAAKAARLAHVEMPSYTEPCAVDGRANAQERS